MESANGSWEGSTINWARLSGLIIIIGLICTFIILMCLTHTWVDRAKLVLTVVMFALSFIGIFVLINQRRWQNDLAHLEMLACQGRDDLMFELTGLRARLAIVKVRLQRRKPDQAKLSKALIGHASSAVLMALKKETGMLQWGFLALRLGKDAFNFINEWLKN